MTTDVDLSSDEKDPDLHYREWLIPMLPQVLDLPVDDLFSGPRLPRWILHERVDSTAMLSAFEAYVHYRPLNEHPYFWNFYNLEHAGRGDSVVYRGRVYKPTVLPTSSYSISKPCDRNGCQRCIDRRPGYVFRWYHPAWSKRYIEDIKKETSWKPSQKEAKRT